MRARAADTDARWFAAESEQWDARSAETPYDFRSKAQYLKKAVVSGDKRSGYFGTRVLNSRVLSPVDFCPWQYTASSA